MFVADLFHPVGALAVEPFLNGDVWRIIRLSIPVLFQMGFILVPCIAPPGCLKYRACAFSFLFSVQVTV
jgi:hypothetical protein